MRNRSLRRFKRFGKDEDGAVMVLTVILMLLMVKVAMSTYNVGVLAAERIRLQMVADTAAYSSALWQARFLNYCAYTRRAVIANYANVALITAADGHSRMLKDYYDEEFSPVIFSWCTGFTIDPDNLLGFPTPRASVEILSPIYQNIIRPAYYDMEARQCAEHLSKMYAASQKVLYTYVSVPWQTIVPDIVKTSNDQADRGLCQIDETMITYKATMTGIFATGGSGILGSTMIEEKNLKFYEEDIKKRFDDFTDPTSIIGPINGSLPYLSNRPYYAMDLIWYLTTYPSSCPDPTRFCCNPMYDDDFEVTAIHVFADPMTFNTDTGQVRTKDYDALGTYFTGWQLVWDPIFTQACFYLPCMNAILDFEDWNSNYTNIYKSDDIKMYNMKTTNLAEMEPSCYVALRIPKSEFTGTRQGDGLLFDNRGVPLGENVQDMIAVSRAKVFFQPRFDQNVYKPNLYHPYWDAKLAPYFGGGALSTTTPIRNNGAAILTAMMTAHQSDATSVLSLSPRIHY